MRFRNSSTNKSTRTLRVAAASVVTVLAVGGVLAGGAAAANAAARPHPLSLAQVDSRVAKSLVQLQMDWSATIGVPLNDGTVVKSPEPVTVSYICTGWFADSTGDIATAGHCVDPTGHATELVDTYLESLAKAHKYGIDPANVGQYKDYAEKHWTVERSDGSTGIDRVVRAYQASNVKGRSLTQSTVASVIDFRRADDADIAALHVDVSGTAGLPVATSNPGVGDSVTSIGFPGAVMLVSDKDTLAPSFKTGTISSHQDADGVGKLEMNADLSGGMSGGPTIDSRGEVVGVNSYTILNESRNFNFVSDTNSTRTFLARQMIQFAKPFPGIVDKAAVQRTWLTFGIIAIIVALLGAAAALLLGLLPGRRGTAGPGTTEAVLVAPTGGPAPAVAPEPVESSPVSSQSTFTQPLLAPQPAGVSVQTGSLPLIAAVQCGQGHLSPADAVFCASCGEALRRTVVSV